jgi:predicted MFS family arabinose efflux permease
MFGVLRQRNFALLWFGGLVSVAGDWVLYAALPFFVYERTRSTVATAGMIAAELGPGALIGSFAGVYVDRLDRRRLLVGTNLLQALTVAALFAVTHASRLWVVYAVAAGQSILASFSMPAESALLPSLVDASELMAANALTALDNRLARLAGVPLGGLLLGLLGLDPVVIVDALSFVVAATMVGLVQLEPREPAARRLSVRGEWLDGLELVRCDRAVALLFAVLGLMTFGGTMIDPLYVAWVRDVLHRGPEVYGLLLATHSSAGIAGTLAVGRYRARVTPTLLMGWASIVAGAVLAVKFDVPVVAVTFALSVIGGATSVASAIGVETLVQSSVADAYRGRVFAALGASGAFFSLAGAVVGGVGARIFGVVAMLNVSAALIVVSGLFVVRSFSSRNGGERRRTDDEEG